MSVVANAETIIGLILGIGTIAAGIGKFLIFDPLRREIKNSTYPISPLANGGLSLPDVAKKLDIVEKRQRDTETKIDLIVELLRKK